MLGLFPDFGIIKSWVRTCPVSNLLTGVYILKSEVLSCHQLIIKK